jgi:hypothetical protein
MKEASRAWSPIRSQRSAASRDRPRLRAPALRLSPLTLGDYFRARFGRPAEVVLTLCIAFSYFGWVAAQFVALGLAFNVLSAGAIDLRTASCLGAVRSSSIRSRAACGRWRSPISCRPS